MKKSAIISVLTCLSFISFSQSIIGNWTGDIDLNGSKLGLEFNITKTDDYQSTMNIPMQGLKDAKAEQTIFTDSKLTIYFPEFKIEYEGEMNGTEEIRGKLTQSDYSFPLNLRKGEILLNRPQEPQPPFVYYSEEFSFTTVDNIKLEGTLTFPQKEGQFPTVIIISGSGPQNRNGEMFGHKPYLVLADYLTKNGIGVLRFDERGVGNSEGDFETATIETFTSDVKAAIQYLKNRKNIKELGLIGHSIGGIIASTIAAESDKIDFVVLMAAPGINGDELMLAQKADFERKLGLNEMQIAQGQELMKGAYEIIANSVLNNEELKDTIHTFYTNKYGNFIPKEQKEALIKQVTGNEFVGLIRTKPSTLLEKIQCPILAINGDKDFQVLSKDNLKAIEESVAKSGNNRVKTIELKNLNHLFQESTTGLLDEYARIEQTISPTALEVISDWIKEQTLLD